MKCILVEYYNQLEKNDYYSTTFELFENIEKAFAFAKDVKVRWIDLVEAINTYYEENNTYYEENGELNYEDLSDTIQDRIITTD